MGQKRVKIRVFNTRIHEFRVLAQNGPNPRILGLLKIMDFAIIQYKMVFLHMNFNLFGQIANL